MSRRVCEKPLVLKARWRRKMIKGIKTHSAGPAEHMVPPTPPHTLTFDKCINPISNQGGLLPFLKHRKSCEIVRADRTIFGSAENVCNFAKRILLFSDFFSCFHGQKSRKLWPAHLQLFIVLSCLSNLWSAHTHILGN